MNRRQPTPQRSTHSYPRRLQRTVICKMRRAAICCFALVSLTNFCVADEPKKQVKGARTTLLRGLVVDEDRKAVANATIKGIRLGMGKSFVTKTNNSGAFAKHIPGEANHGIPLLVQDPTGKLTSFVSGFDYEVSDAKPFTIVLKPSQQSVVTVTDKDGKPVVGASVNLIASHSLIAEFETDKAGVAKLDFPADAKVDWIYAYKSEVGFDYYENYDAFPTQDRLDVPNKLNLSLNGAVPLSVTVQDSQGQPVSGVMVLPWTIKKKDKLSFINLSGTGDQFSDADGKCTFGWIPNDMDYAVSFLGHSADHFCPGNPTYKVSKPDKTDLTMKVLQKATVRGRVTYDDGTPAAGIRLQGEGRGATNHYFRGYTSTGEDGTYELQIYPDQNTIIAVLDKQVAAESAVDILLREGKAGKADFELIGGTIISGIITAGKNKTPTAKQTATLIEKGDNGATLVQWSETNEQGRYRFCVGPGTYTLRLVEGKATPIQVKDEATMTFDKHIARLPRGQFSGTVIDLDGNAVGDASIQGEPIDNDGHAGFTTTSKADGSFETERWKDNMSVLAIDTKRSLAGYARIKPDDDSVTIQLEPAASVSTTVVDKAGKPLANCRIQLTINNKDPGGASIYRMSRTDKDGRVKFTAVPLGATHRIYAHADSGSTELDFKADKPEHKELEKLVCDVNPAP